MKWSTAAIVLLDANDDAILRDATPWKLRYGIPDHHCFSAPLRSGAVLKGFSPLSPGCLAFSDLGTKIIVISHGTAHGVSIDHKLYRAEAVARWFSDWGLRGAGLIAFRGCSLGRGAFLDALADKLTYLDIHVGWLLGYKDVARQLGFAATECIGPYDYKLRKLTKGQAKLPDDRRVKIVQGNRDVVPLTGPSPPHYTQVSPVRARART